jgi:acyl carrier protein
MDTKIKDKIITIIENEIKFLIDSINHELPIRDQITIDSMQFITIIANLEEELGITIPTSILGVSTLNEFFFELDKAIV